jgi:hypothetical protein
MENTNNQNIMKPETPETNTENQTQKFSDLLAQFYKLKLAHYACAHFESSRPKYEELEGLFLAKLDELLQDKHRLDWILNRYTLSCGITREEVDEKMYELGVPF